jgi:hypothetical protein
MNWNQATATPRTGSVGFRRSSFLYLLLATGLMLCIDQVYAQPAQPDGKQDQADKPQDRPARQTKTPPAPGAKPDQGKTRPQRGQTPQTAPKGPPPKSPDRKQGDQSQRRPQPPPQATPARPPARGGNPGDRARSYPPRIPTQRQWRDWERQRNWRRNGAWRGQPTWQLGRARNWRADHRTWVQRGGYGGFYIPWAQFSLSFGAGRFFRIGPQPIIVDGYPRFQYGGYSFLMVDPWPEDWSSDWYANDDVYIDYNDGYYLYNRRYPGVGIAVSVVMPVS